MTKHNEHQPLAILVGVGLALALAMTLFLIINPNAISEVLTTPCNVSECN